MILVTGGTGFIGSHLVEAVCALASRYDAWSAGSFKRHLAFLPELSLCSATSFPARV